MANDIRISGSELQWRNSANTVYSLEGSDEGASNASPRSIRISNNYIEYVDNNGRIRRLGRESIGSVEVAAQRSLRVNGNDLEYVGVGETPFPIYKAVAPIQPPSSSPTNLNVTFPTGGGLPPFPWGADATWNNVSNNGTNIRIQWYRNGALVENESKSISSTSDSTNSNYYSDGDFLECYVFYQNSAGSGSAAYWSGTVSEANATP